MTLTDFLLVRIAEDEAVLESASDLSDRLDPHEDIRSEGDRVRWEVLAAVSEHYPFTRLLAECQTKRRIVEGVIAAVSGMDKEAIPSAGYGLADEVLALLALPYADHPEYQQEWKP